MSRAEADDDVIGAPAPPVYEPVWPITLLVVAVFLPTVMAFADQGIPIIQHGRAFDRADITIHQGDTLKFLNQDDFDHQIYVQSPDFNFESDESSPGHVIPLPFTKTGRFEVRCHIHPKMRLVVTVQ